METMRVNDSEYKILKLLGKGKGGYSYLAEKSGGLFVLKQIHHKPCDYYQFGNKIEAEMRDYERLLQAGIKIPRKIEIDEKSERIVKEFIDGKTIFELLERAEDVSPYLPEVRKMAANAKSHGLNIDYYPTNFVCRQSDGELFYIDYECNDYCDEWNFENWGIKHWIRKNAPQNENEN